jgi:hypothetical protein
MRAEVTRLLSAAGIAGGLVGIAEYSLPESRDPVLRSISAVLVVALLPPFVRASERAEERALEPGERGEHRR